MVTFNCCDLCGRRPDVLAALPIPGGRGVLQVCRICFAGHCSVSGPGAAVARDRAAFANHPSSHGKAHPPR